MAEKKKKYFFCHVQDTTRYYLGKISKMYTIVNDIEFTGVDLFYFPTVPNERKLRFCALQFRLKVALNTFFFDQIPDLCTL